MKPEELFEKLRPIQEKQGNYFNVDMDMTLPLLESLLTNKERYGRMTCPCRLAQEDYEKDKDIICPCVYREPDLKEFGACYCGLYVTKEWNDGTIEHNYVPERRPGSMIG